MIKQIMVISGIFSFSGAMELHLMEPYGNHGEVGLSASEAELTRSYEAQEMSWLPRLYDASGLKHCMSRECFMVNALAKIKESIASAQCSLRPQDCAPEVECPSERDGESLFMGANVSISALVLAATIFKGLACLDKPLKFPEGLVMGSCAMARSIFNYSYGMDWADNCKILSLKFDKPCNLTAAREEFNKNGGKFYSPSFCCYEIADPYCYKEGIEYNREIYPALHDQAVWDCWTPFLIAAPAIIVFQLGYIGGFKLRSYLRKKAFAQRLAAAQAEIVKEIIEEEAEINA